MSASYIQCKLYLEGLEVPFNSISIQESTGGPPSAVVSLPLSDAFLYMLPKTLAHVFYSDATSDGGEPEYYLIFEGSLAGISFSRSGSNRGIEATFTSLVDELNRAYLKKGTIQNPATFDGHMVVMNGDMDSGGVDGGKRSRPPKKLVMSDEVPTNTATSVLVTALNEGSTLKEFFTGENGLIPLVLANNPYPKLLDKSLKISNRIITLDNNIGNDNISQAALNKLLKDNVVRWPVYVPLNSILTELTSFLNYEFNAVAAPSYTDDDTGNKAPISLFIKPRTDYFLPALCNVVLPNEVVRMSYARNMASEPTRHIMRLDPLQISLGAAENAFGLHEWVSPKLIFRESENKLSGKMTDEEKIRGINATRAKASSGLAYTLADVYSAKKNNQEPTEDPEGPILGINDLTIIDDIFTGEDDSKAGDGVIQKMVDLKFFDQRYRYRTFDITTVYSPHRLVGFPALIVDPIFPSVYGTIAGITTIISAGGTATQTLSIRAPKLVSENAVIGSSQTKNVGLYYNDYIPSFPALFDDSKYGASKIYSETYPQITGELEDSNLKDYLDKVTEETNDPTKVMQAFVTYIKTITQGVSEADINRTIKPLLKRSLVKESDFWNFVLADPTKPLNSEEHTYMATSLGDSPVDDGDYNSWGNEAEGKPFVKERQDRVYQAIIQGNVYNV